MDDGPCAIVGIGVSAASFTSLRHVFAHIGPGCGLSYLIAIGQTDGVSVQAVLDALAEDNALPAMLARNGERLAPNCIYVAAPNGMIRIDDGAIRTWTAAEPTGRRGRLDSLLISLAEQAHERAVAVLLAGLGSEGSAGITATKKQGRLSIAETCEGQDLAAPGSDTPAAVADLRLPPEQIALEIARYVRNLALMAEHDGQETLPADIEAHVTQIATILRNVTSHDFHGYKRGTFVRRLHRRMQVQQIAAVVDYLERLHQDREEVQRLFQDLLIGVTQFFRDRPNSRCWSARSHACSMARVQAINSASGCWDVRPARKRTRSRSCCANTWRRWTGRRMCRSSPSIWMRAH